MAEPRLNDPLTADQLRALLDYDPATGIFTWRKRDQLGHYARTWNTRWAGKHAGCHKKASHDYIVIRVNDWLYRAHRLAWLWMTGEWPDPGLEVDHRNGNGLNNRWRNLRIASSSQSKMNTKRRSDNTTGHKGVWFEKRRNSWVAEVWANGTKHHIGAFPTAEIAKSARDHAARRLHGSFARSK